MRCYQQGRILDLFLYPSIPSPYFTYYHSLALESIRLERRNFHSQTSFYYLGGDHSATFRRLIYRKISHWIYLLVTNLGSLLYASYWNNQHEKPYKTEKIKYLSLLSADNINPFPDKIKDPNKARAIIAHHHHFNDYRERETHMGYVFIIFFILSFFIVHIRAHPSTRRWRSSSKGDKTTRKHPQYILSSSSKTYCIYCMYI